MPANTNDAGATSPLDVLMFDATSVARMIACSKRHLARLVDAGEFPRPVSVGAKLKRWPRTVVLAWIDAKTTATARR